MLMRGRGVRQMLNIADGRGRGGLKTLHLANVKYMWTVGCFTKTQSISDQVPLLVCSVTIISKTSPKKLDNFDEN